MEKCIIKTLSYFDLFDYPLTLFEIKKYLCCEVESTDEELLDMLASISSIQESGGFYYLLGRKEILEKRNERNEISVKKHAKAKIVAKILSVIPTIQYIGISGSLSMNNASSSDDIDFFIVTRKNSLWISRILVNVFLLLIKQKRARGSKNFEDKICPNMFVEETRMSFTGKRRTLYTAHEIAQLKPVFDRNGTHSVLLNKNKWISKFLPNIPVPKRVQRKPSFVEKVLLDLLVPIEKISYICQLHYMKKRRSIEFVTAHRAFFHPIDRQKLIMTMFQLRYNRYRTIYEDNMWIDKEEARFYLEQKKIRILN